MYHATIDEGTVRRGTVDYYHTGVSHHRGTISHVARVSHTYCIVQGELILSDNTRGRDHVIVNEVDVRSATVIEDDGGAGGTVEKPVIYLY